MSVSARITTRTTSTVRPRDAAIAYATRGWPVIPLHSIRDARCTCGKAKCDSPGKHPHTTHGLKDASTDERIIRRWWKRWPDANVGVATGASSGIVVIDIDPRHAGEDSLANLEHDHGPLPETVEAITGGGGRHVFFAHPGNKVTISNSSGRLGAGVDVRGDGGYIVAPPSIHITGRGYEWKGLHHAEDTELAALPDWLLKLVREQPKATRPVTDTGEAVSVAEIIRAGRRNAALASIAGTMRRRGLLEPEIRAALLEVNRSRCRPPLDEQEVSGIAASIARYAVGTNRQLSEQGGTNKHIIQRSEPIPLAEHFIDAHHRDGNGRLLLRRWQGDFYKFDGSCYKPITDEGLDAALYRHLDRCWKIKRGSGGEPQLNGSGQPMLTKLVPKASMVREVRLAIPSRNVLIDDRLDAPVWLDGRAAPKPLELVACANGLLHMPTGDLHPATPLLFNTNALPFDYDPHAPEPVEWLSFLDQLWPSDPQAITTLQEWSGYSVSHDTRQHKILLLVGPKRAGKGTIGRVLTGLVGPVNVAAPPLSSLGQNFGLQPLLGKMLAIISDARLSGRADHAIVIERLLSISGEDAVTVDRKHRDPLTTRLPTRFMLLTNELPRLADPSGALASRFILLTLTKSWYGREDHELTDRLLAELPGVLNWAIDGWVNLQERGHFVQPESSAEAIRDLEELGSPIGAFIRDRCIVQPGQTVECGVLFEAWKLWCAEQGRDRPGTRQSFGRDLRAAVPGLRSKQPRDGGARTRFYEGIGLLDGPEIEGGTQWHA